MRHFLLALLLTLTACLKAQSWSPFDSISVQYEVQASISDNKTPLWLNANKYGLSSLDKFNGYARATMIRDSKLDYTRKWDLGYGVDVALPFNYTTKVAVQQLFAEVRYRRMTFGIGSKCRPMEFKNQTLSSGGQALGINARPVPQVYISADDYMTVPFTKKWISVKGLLSYGWMTDGHWQREFTNGDSRWANNTLYHSKAGYLKVGKESRPFSVEVGLEMASLFGGKIHWYGLNNRYEEYEGGHGLSSFWHALIPGGSDFREKDETKYINAEGDLLGSWLVRMNYQHKSFDISIYADKFFEDHSSLYNLGYYGYGKDGDWQTRNKKFFFYPFKDGLLGLELSLKKQDYLKHLVVEFINSRYQSGPIYHDHSETIYDQIGGKDDFYNHSNYAGWQYYGQVIGNPLYLSPIYNEDGMVRVKDNRFWAWHFGVDGNLNARLSYRMLATWQEGFGTYFFPYLNSRRNFSMLAEFDYDMSETLKGLSMRLGYGLDNGELMGNNNGVQITFTYKH